MRRFIWTAVFGLLGVVALFASVKGQAPGVRTEPLVGGVATRERPEVGKVQNVDGLCTGTLVGSAWVLTASHCFDHLNLFFDRTHPGRFFEITPERPEAIPQRFPIIGAHTLGFPIGPLDLMLLRLSREVPSDLARPARIADRPPMDGSPITVLGYGGNPGNPGLFGSKQVVETTVNIGSRGEFWARNVFQPGDSGGPGFLGRRGDRGDLFGVNAQSVGSISIFADAAGRKLVIQGFMAGAEAVGERDITRARWCTGDGEELFYGDLNGDRLLDALCWRRGPGPTAGLRYAWGVASGRLPGAPGVEVTPSGAVAGGIFPSGGRPYCNIEGDQLHVGDFNGDRRTDILCFNPRWGRVYVALSSGRKLTPYEAGPPFNRETRWCTHATAELHVGDFNGDGRTDLLCHDTRTGQKWLRLAWSEIGNLFREVDDYISTEPWCSHEGARMHVSDFDGDGRSDLLCHTPTGRLPGGLHLKASGLLRPGEHLLLQRGTTWADERAGFCTEGELRAYDMTGNGRADLVCSRRGGGGSIIFAVTAEVQPGRPFRTDLSWTQKQWGEGRDRPWLPGNVAAQPWGRRR